MLKTQKTQKYKKCKKCKKHKKWSLDFAIALVFLCFLHILFYGFTFSMFLCYLHFTAFLRLLTSLSFHAF